MARRKIFHRYQRRFIPLAALITLIATWLVTSAALIQGGWVGVAMFGLFLWLVCDRMVLFGNRWLRRKVRDKVVGLGEMREAEGAWFVGLAHPCHTTTLRRRVLETDDDVGFLSFDWSGLHFRGDVNHFDLPASEIADVKLVRSTFAPWGRIEIVTTHGEPYDSLILSSRDYGSHAACCTETIHLYEKLRGLLILNQPVGRLRMSGEFSAQLVEHSVR